MKTKTRYYILFLLVILPVFFLFSSRYTNIVPISIPEKHWDLIILIILAYFFAMLFYWALVGHLFARWLGSFKKSFFLGNLPVFLNACGEWIYYVMLGKHGEELPLVAYLIGSHIDKINLFPFEPMWLDILIDSAVLLAVFTAGYEIKKRRVTDPYPRED